MFRSTTTFACTAGVLLSLATAVRAQRAPLPPEPARAPAAPAPLPAETPLVPRVPLLAQVPLAPAAPLAEAIAFEAARAAEDWAREFTEFGAEFAEFGAALERAYAPSLAGTTLGGNARFPQDPADSLYRVARTLLNRGEWRQAAAMFQQIAARQPVSRYAPDALYWQAFALYRLGGTAELREALGALDARRARFPEAAQKSESDALALRISGALASRGDAAARERVNRLASAGTAACDAEELSVRSSALSALSRSDPEAAQELVSRILARRDECSIPLRKHAVMLVGTRGDAAARTRLADVVRNDPAPAVRADAIGYLAKASGDDVVSALESVIRNDAEDDHVQRAAIRALGEHESARAKAAIRALVERSSAPERLRLEALSTFDRGVGFAYAFTTAPRPAVAPAAPSTPAAASAAEAAAEVAARSEEIRAQAREAAVRAAAAGVAVSGDLTAFDGVRWGTPSARDMERRLSAEDAAWLRGVYPRLETNRLKSRAVQVLARSGDDATLTWLMNLIVREEEPADVRATVLSRLGRDLPIAQLARFYDGAATRTVREQIVSVLGAREEPEATDKLIEIVRSGTDPQLRRSAISALGRKKDPRTTQLLLELIDKP